MMEEPVQNESDSSTKLNSLEDQRMSSSENLDRCIIRMEDADMNSRAKSLSDTESREFLVTSSKSSSSATYSRSMGKVVPARAPAPRGRALRRLRQSSIRPLSRLN